jgi:hypothetical protein
VTSGRRHGMVRPVHFRVLPLLLATALAGGCAGGTETGNPPIRARLSYAAYSSDPSVRIREPAAAATVTSVWLTLADVGFTPGSGCAGQAAPVFRAPGIGVGDHASGATVTTTFSLEPGDYCAVTLPLALADALPNEAPALLLGASVLVTGMLADATPFTIQSRSAPILSLHPTGAAFEIEPEQAHTLLGFDVSAWVDGIDWASAEATSDGIEISADRNPALLTRFEANLPRGVRLFRDREGDGRMDQDPETLARP